MNVSPSRGCWSVAFARVDARLVVGVSVSPGADPPSGCWRRAYARWRSGGSYPILARMPEISFATGELTREEQDVVAAGFAAHARDLDAPPFARACVVWRVHSEEGALVGALTGSALWDWLYIDELWIDTPLRGAGLGGRLMRTAEAHAARSSLVGVWLWTQSWQAADFYAHLGYERFAELPDFPRGHARIGFRKILG